MSTITYYIQGMHCAACEIVIEKTIIKEKSVESVDASTSSGSVIVEYNSPKTLSVNYFNKLFKKDGYHFSLNNPTSEPVADPMTALLIGAAFIVGYILLAKTGYSSLISVNATSSLPVFFLFGLLAGVSSCAALVGGIVLSLSKQWLNSYSENDSTLKKAEPHFMFNIGRVIGYAGFGLVLGTIGNYFRLSPVVSATLVIGVSLVMILLGLQMVGVKALQHFQIRFPKFLTSKLSDESNFKGRTGPFFMGALTFFLPCGFTITAQALALASGSPIQGALIMCLFALGTVPGLLAIGLSSVKLYSNPQKSKQFSLIAGMLVLFFALFNINAQLSVLGISTSIVNQKTTGELPPIVNGTQIIKIIAGSTYSPSKILLRANTPTRWEVTASGIGGCTNAIISRGLFDGQIDLVEGQVSVKEFTTPKPGVYKFSCWMGMVSGTVEVVDANGKSGSPNLAPAESGAKGCGCGGGTTCGGR